MISGYDVVVTTSDDIIIFHLLPKDVRMRAKKDTIRDAWTEVAILDIILCLRKTSTAVFTF